MERLTKRVSANCIELSSECNPIGFCNCPQRVYNTHNYWNVFKRLAEYEDAEEQGLLLRLKVRPGDSLYKPNPITLKEIVEIRIESIFITESGINISGRTTKMHYSYCCSPSDIGKTVFLSYEEAESALAEKGGAEC